MFEARLFRSAARRLATVLLGGAATLASAGEVPVAVAANFAAPMQKIADAFQRATGHRATLALGSTGRFYAQVRNGAPFHVLLAADEETPARLEREGFAVPGTRQTYATGRLVLWSAAPGRVDPQGELLRQPSQERLVIADPRLAPYGAAAMEVMQSLDLLPALRSRLVQADSIGQAFQIVASGNAPLGFVALAQVQSEGRIDKGSGWVVPAHLHRPIRQDAVLLAAGRDNPAARSLLEFLRGSQARSIMRAHGYEV